MIEEQSLCYHCVHRRPDHWCAEFNNDMYRVETCSEFKKTARPSNSSVPAGYGAWISVATRLPEDNEEVSIAFWDGVAMCRAYGAHIDGVWYIGDFPFEGGDWVVHYWQPAPPLPPAP